jgi:hypothetical protein
MRGHRRPYAENARLVRRGGDYSSLAETADDDGVPAERWLVTLLDRCVEGIEIGMQDGRLTHETSMPRCWDGFGASRWAYDAAVGAT